jgi:hypothetical protein
MAVDARVRQLKGCHRLAVAGIDRGGNLGGADAQAGFGEIEPVEALRQLDQRGIAAGANVGDDGAHRVVYVGRGLALGGEKDRECALEAGIAGVQSLWHRLASAGSLSGNSRL